MSSDIKTITTPLPAGKVTTLLRGPMAAGTAEITFTLDCDSVLLSLYVGSITSGTITVNAYTQVEEGKETLILSFPVISAPTADLLLQKAAIAMGRVRVEVIATDACDIDVRAKGITAGETSVRIQGANNWQVSQIDIPSTPTLLIPTSLVDRSGLVFKNNSNTNVLYVAETSLKATTSIGYPIGPRESLAFDLAAGDEIWAVSDGADIDVRIAEAGGS